MDWIAKGAKRELKWFVLENVVGILKRKKHEQETFSDQIIAQLLERLPEGWSIDIQKLNSCDFGVPQSRPRVFIVGVAPELKSTARQRKVLALDASAFKVQGEVMLEDVLDKRSQPSDFDRLPISQQLNVLMQLDNFHIIGSQYPGIVDIERDPLKEVDSGIAVNGTRTLRTNNAGLWILPATASHAQQYGPRGRFLTWAEKARLAGMTPCSLKSLSIREVEIAVGNTIPVPMIGAVLTPVLAAWKIFKQRAHMAQLSLRALHSCDDDGPEDELVQ